MNDLLSVCRVRSFETLLAAYKRAGVCLNDAIDGGAGSGKTAAEMLRHLPETAKVYAFEPFPGNHRFFEGCDPRVVLVKKAMAEQERQMNFAVQSVVSEASTWGKRGMTGYSSVGRLVEHEGGSGLNLKVECVRADAVVAGGAKVGFIKLDLQGGELNALQGCAGLLSETALMWIEYSGQKGLLDFLYEEGFVVFDTEYMFVGSPGAEARSLFDVSRENVVLSTSSTAWFGFKKSAWKNHEDELESCKRRFRLVQTDLVCVNKRLLKSFLAAAPHL